MPGRPRGRFCERDRIVGSTTTVHEKPHLHAHARRCTSDQTTQTSCDSQKLISSKPECALSSTWTTMRKKGKFVDSTTTANETPHMHVHACRCAGVCVCVCKGSLYALPAGVSSCKTCRRAYPAGYRALEAGLDRESRKTACLIDPLRAELIARVQSSPGALTPLVAQRSRLSALIGPSMCLQGANNTTTKN